MAGYVLQMKINIYGIFLLITCVFGGKDVPLYKPGDPLVLLNSTNFENTVKGTSNAWFIEFYNRYCGHCIKFAPEWKRLGNRVKEWGSAIKLAAIDCSVEENLELCREYEAHGYPTLKFLPPKALPQDIGALYDGTRKVSVLEEEIIHFIEENIHWLPTRVRKALEPLMHLESIWSNVKDNQEAVVIFEEPESYLATKVILDTLNFDNVVVRRLDKVEASKFGVLKFPSMYHIQQHGVFSELAHGEDRLYYTNKVRSLVGHEALTEATVTAAPEQDEEDDEEEGEEAGEDKLNFKEVDKVHMQDLESALHYSLRQEVATQKTITMEMLVALKDYVHALAKYFPGQESIIRYLWSLNNWLQPRTTELSGQEWSDKLDELQTRRSELPRTVTWTGCKGSSSRYRGYSCAVWTLFHTLTVSADQIGREDAEHDPQEVLLAMRGYIHHFFGCRQCAEHFVAMAKDLEHTVHTSDDSILLLWEFHNRANKRLSGDETEDPKFPKIQFPNKALCPKCRTEKDGKEIWKMSTLLRYLKHVFKEKYIVPDSKLIIPTHAPEVDSEHAKYEEQRKEDIRKLQKLKEEKEERKKKKVPTATLR